MNRPPDKYNCIFQQRVLIERDRMAESNIDIIRYEKDRMARDLGDFIMKKKQPFRMEPPAHGSNAMELSTKLYVFTEAEMQQLMDYEAERRLA